METTRYIFKFWINNFKLELANTERSWSVLRGRRFSLNVGMRVQACEISTILIIINKGGPPRLPYLIIQDWGQLLLKVV